MKNSLCLGLLIYSSMGICMTTETPHIEGLDTIKARINRLQHLLNHQEKQIQKLNEEGKKIQFLLKNKKNTEQQLKEAKESLSRELQKKYRYYQGTQQESESV